ncbi:MAG TPA: hypothetical protein VJP02_10275 [Candidatus Sulfotelmatobacter sp.]|nr:hypothetical protein [Candidatus Sulfotelmatobacter sp.]
MPRRALSFSTCLLAIVVSAPLSQRSAAQTLPVRVQQFPPAPPGRVARPPHPHQQPCWEAAGISKSAMEQRRAIQQRARSEVDAVCADSSLSPQQRQQKIRQIHQSAKQQLDALVSPQQMEALKSCQISRSHGGAHPGGRHPTVGGGHGPCGELPSRSAPKPAPGGKPEPEEED